MFTSLPNLFWYITKTIYYFTLTSLWQITIIFNTPNITLIPKVQTQLHIHITLLVFTYSLHNKFIYISINPSMSIFCQHFHEYTHLFKCPQAAENLLQHQIVLQFINSHPSAKNHHINMK